MSARLTLGGLDEFRVALQRLPEELTNEAIGIVDQEANTFVADLKASYPERAAGELGSHVRQSRTRAGPFQAGAVVRNTSPLAHIFERGTVARHTKLGADRGMMPPGHVFGPRAGKYKAELRQRIKGMAEARGLVVTVTDE